MKNTPIPFLIMALCLLLTACISNSAKVPVSESADLQPQAADTVEPADLRSTAPTKASTDSATFTKEFGSYSVPTGWIESEKYSKKHEFFYLLEGTEGSPTSSNISIKTGTNQYAADDHLRFRDAIVRQLAVPEPETDDNLITGNGSTTANGYVLYSFNFKKEGADVTYTQHYIVGDYKFVLVYESAFGDTQEADAATKTMIDSFLWAE